MNTDFARQSRRAILDEVGKKRAKILIAKNNKINLKTIFVDETKHLSFENYLHSLDKYIPELDYMLLVKSSASFIAADISTDGNDVAWVNIMELSDA